MSAGVGDHAALVEDTPTTYYEEIVRIPGMGEPPERCRGLSPVGFCEAGHTILGRSSCGTRYCPDHWRDWIEDAVVSVVARLAAYREAVDGAERPAAHVVASPPQDRRYSVDRLWATRREAYDALEATGVPGGVMVTHPYRTNDRGDALYATARESGAVDEGTGRWRFLRDATDDWDDLAQYVEAAPHYHTLVPVNYVDGEAAPGGWVVKNIRKVDRFQLHNLGSYRSMARVVYYVLTHGGVQTGRQLVTYFGDVHPASFDPSEELTASAWYTIQKKAEQAVKGEEESSGAGCGPEKCPHEECEAVARDLIYLSEYLDDEDWVSSIRAQRDGRARWLRLRGVFLWSKDMTDRPPPIESRGRWLEWLEERGRATTPEPSQVALPLA